MMDITTNSWLMFIGRRPQADVDDVQLVRKKRC